MAGGKILILGVGLQGRAVLDDLLKRSDVDQVVAADHNLKALEAFAAGQPSGKLTTRQADVRDDAALRALFAGIDLVIELLPVEFQQKIARAAIDAGIPMVSTSYGHRLRAMDAEARDRGVTIMPESGMDPGIDLVMAAEAVAAFDEVESLVSYGGGFPAPECKDANPLHYKISWHFPGVLRSYYRAGRVLIDGTEVETEPREQFEPAWTHEVDVEELGTMEAFVNGDAVPFVEALGLRASIKATGRFALRWPGHCAFWRTVSALGLLDDAVPAGSDVSPREFLRRHLEPRLQYAADERDAVALRVEVIGTKAGKRAARRLDMIDYRDVQTGLMAMNRTVGYPASIIAQMILRGDVARRGVLSPITDVPRRPFFDALAERGIVVTDTPIEPADCRWPRPERSGNLM